MFRGQGNRAADRQGLISELIKRQWNSGAISFHRSVGCPESRIMLASLSVGDVANWSTNNRRQLNGRAASDQFSGPRACGGRVACAWDSDSRSNPSPDTPCADPRCSQVPTNWHLFRTVQFARIIGNCVRQLVEVLEHLPRETFINTTRVFYKTHWNFVRTAMRHHCSDYADKSCNQSENVQQITNARGLVITRR